MITLDEMEALLDEIAESLPPELFQGLNGGIMLLPETKLNQHGVANDLYILGEYHHGGIFGRFIAIYYGSFEAVFWNLSLEDLRARLAATLKHEFRHHLESLAGERGLEIEDEAYIAAYLRSRRQGT